MGPDRVLPPEASGGHAGPRLTRVPEFGSNSSSGRLECAPTCRRGPRPAQRPTHRGTEMATGYCLKCKKQVEMQNAQAITMKNGKPATTGTCPTCGTKIFKIGKAA